VIKLVLDCRPAWMTRPYSMIFVSGDGAGGGARRSVVAAALRISPRGFKWSGRLRATGSVLRGDWGTSRVFLWALTPLAAGPCRRFFYAAGTGGGSLPSAA